MFLFKNGRIITHDEQIPYLDRGAVAVSNDCIIAVSDEKQLFADYPKAETIDARGGLIMPGFINLHSRCTDIYSIGLAGSAQSAGLRSGYAAADRQKKLKAGLNLEYLRNAAAAAAVESIRNGITSVFEYHSSPSCTSGSLQTIASAFREIGIRASVCCEVDENEPWRLQQAAAEENLNFYNYCAAVRDSRMHPAFGLRIADGANGDNLSSYREFWKDKTGFHVLLDNSEFNIGNSLRKYRKTPAERMIDSGIAGENTIAAASRFDNGEFEALAKTGTRVVPLFAEECGKARLSADCRYVPGLSAGASRFDMLESARAASGEFGRSEAGMYSPKSAERMLFEANAETASKLFGETVGVIRPGAKADIIVIDYDCYTPMNAYNAEQHVVLNCSGRKCRTVMTDGKLLMLDGDLIGISGSDIKLHAQRSAEKLWSALY